MKLNLVFQFALSTTPIRKIYSHPVFSEILTAITQTHVFIFDVKAKTHLSQRILLPAQEEQLLSVSFVKIQPIHSLQILKHAEILIGSTSTLYLIRSQFNPQSQIILKNQSPILKICQNINPDPKFKPIIVQTQSSVLTFKNIEKFNKINAVNPSVANFNQNCIIASYNRIFELPLINQNMEMILRQKQFPDKIIEIFSDSTGSITFILFENLGIYRLIDDESCEFQLDLIVQLPEYSKLGQISVSEFGDFVLVSSLQGSGKSILISVKQKNYIEFGSENVRFGGCFSGNFIVLSCLGDIEIWQIIE